MSSKRVFRAPLAGYTPRERAEAAERRPDKATSRAGAQRPAIRTLDEGTQVLLVTPGDIDALAGDTTEAVRA
ncbi:hypothetical protein [Massilia sp. METH4]|uniref:hypothetical protein n=1 Tax=Massilia sp. METH4 TaxID=3123041 RepID=UPI0030D3A4D6